MHVINIHAAHMSCMNSRYHCNSLQSIHLLITLTECTQRSQACDPTLQHTSGSKVCLSTDKFNKWVREALTKNKPSTREQSSDWDYTSLVLLGVFVLRASVRSHHRSRWVHLKHRLSKREYKVVLSKTYVGTILLMHMYQGKGRWGFTCSSANFELASPELRVPDLR